MELLSPTSLKALCEKYHLTPSKQYGQNYLITKKPIEKMIDVADLQKTDTVIEIGPGFGILTTALAPQVKQVIAFEIEQKIREYWDTLQNTHKNIEVVWGNVLTTWHKKEKEVKKGFQAFHIGARYDGEKIRAQIDNVEKYTDGGWLLWNAANNYSTAGLTLTEES